MSVRALDFEREDDLPEELPSEEALLEALREDLAELLLVLADLDAPLLLEPLLFVELPVEPLFDLLLPDRAFAEDERGPDERELLLFRDLLLDFEGIGISFSCLLLCDEYARASGCQ
jgi:hypothetical protein